MGSVTCWLSKVVKADKGEVEERTKKKKTKGMREQRRERTPTRLQAVCVGMHGDTVSKRERARAQKRERKRREREEGEEREKQL